LPNVSVTIKYITLTFANFKYNFKYKSKLVLHEKYILQLYSIVILTFRKLFIICLHIIAYFYFFTVY